MEFSVEIVSGVWTLVSATAVDADGKPKSLPYGPTPMGTLTLAPSGRMMAVLGDGRVALPPDAERAYSSYCGNYEIKSDRLITTVDAASIATRIGSQQIRRLRMEGNDLVLIPPVRSDGEQRELVWRRLGPA